MSAQDTESIYAELPPSLKRKIAGKATDRTAQPSDHDASVFGLVPVIARSAAKAKLAHPRLPLENPAKESDETKKRKEAAAEERRRQKAARKRRRSGRMVPTDLSDAQKKAKHDRPLVRGRMSYNLLEPLHRLWLGYISELLGLSLQHAASPKQIASGSVASTSRAAVYAGPLNRECVSMQHAGYSLNTVQGWQSKLVKADFHGAKLEVTKAKHPSLVGLAGIVVQETEGTFRIVTSKNDVKVVPKPSVTFACSLPLNTNDGAQKAITFELYGGNFGFRSADRASKKFKAKGTKGLDY